MSDGEPFGTVGSADDFDDDYEDSDFEEVGGDDFMAGSTEDFQNFGAEVAECTCENNFHDSISLSVLSSEKTVLYIA